MDNKRLTLLLVLFSLAGVPSMGLAQSRVPDLSQMSIEDLMNVEVTSASRKEQRVADIAASVFVITQDDIRRSGMTTLPDVLRMAPGIEVAQINSNKWAVSVRGFNALYANKLLVLVDGRSLYNRIFSGVLWDTEDLMLDDVDRIEVIRGPGAAMWGANAVNAVINIVTRTTADTQGGLARVDIGRAGDQGAVRYGGTVGTASYRVYSQWTGRDQSLMAPDIRANDASHSVTTGFRTDWTTDAGAIMLTGDFTAGQARALWPNLNPETATREPLANEPSDTQGGHLLARWTHTRAGGASLQIQSFVDIGSRREPVGDYSRHAVGVDTQYHTVLSAHQDLVAGAGYRFIDESLVGRVGLSLNPAKGDSTLLTAFLQDEITLLKKRLAVTLGSQVQYDSDARGGIQPTARVIWKGLPHQGIWAAASRALRTPSLNERRIRLDYPPVPSPSGLPLFVSAFGNPALKTETFVDVEGGYRVEIGTTAWIIATAFVGRYDHLVTQEVADPVVQFVPSPQIVVTSLNDNQLKATTRGFELAAHWTPVRFWRLDASHTVLGITPKPAAGSRDLLAATEDGSVPGTQWQLRSSYSPGRHATVAVALFHVGPLVRFQVDGYTRADISAEWQFTRRLSVMAIGQNLFQAAHAEFAGTTSLLLPTQVPRSAGLRLRWVF